MSGKNTVPVLAAPLIDPGMGRIDLELPHGLTLTEIVKATLPHANAHDISHLRVVLVSKSGAVVIAADRWHRVRPRPGVHVVIRLIPGKNFLKSLLQIVVSVVAVALGQYWAAPFFGGGVVGAVAGAIVGAGVTPLGVLQVNPLSPAA
jgi:hypothetical protein